jgi:protein-disulfide isomerase
METLKVPVSPHDHAQGPLNAPLILVQYGDYECPYCGMAYPIVKQVQRHFGAKLRFVFRNFPIPEAHPQALSAAQVAEFAAVHAKFWQMHDLLYENQADLGLELYLALAEKLELSVAAMQNALEQGSYRQRIEADVLGGERSGVNGTPTFFINGKRHGASYEYDVLATALNRALQN